MRDQALPATKKKIKETIEVLEETFAGYTVEERAYVLMKSYFSLTPEECGDMEDLQQIFTEWFLSTDNEEVKDKVLERIFFDICDTAI